MEEENVGSGGEVVEDLPEGNFEQHDAVEIEPVNEEMNQAASKIQAQFRGNNVRKQLQSEGTPTRSRPGKIQKHRETAKSNFTLDSDYYSVDGADSGAMKSPKGSAKPDSNAYDSALKIAKEQVEIEEAETEKLNTLVGDKLALSAPRSNSRSIVGKKNASRAGSVAGGKIARSPSIRGGLDGPAVGEGVAGPPPIGGPMAGMEQMGGNTIITSASYINGLKSEIEELKKQMKEKEEAAAKDKSGIEFELRAERLKSTDMMKTFEKRYADKDEEKAAAVADKENEVSMLKERLDQELQDVKSLEAEIKHQESEFDLLTEALSDKDAEVNKHLQAILDGKEHYAMLEKEIDRLKVIIRRHEKTIEKMHPPESHEVCLSARSFSEELLISLRDEDITNKAKQIDMLTTSNNKLLVNLDTIEATMEKLQQDILSKNIAISKLESTLRKRDATIEKQEQAIKVLNGREAAMEVATQQNSKLLQLLQQQEIKSAQVTEENVASKNALKEFKLKYIAALKESAELEAQVEKYRSEGVETKRTIEEFRTKYQKEVETLSAQAGEATRASHFKEQNTMEELRTRRETQYVLLDRLTAAEETMRKAQDDIENMTEAQRVLEIRNEDLERRLEEARVANEEAALAKMELTDQFADKMSVKDKELIDVRKEFDVSVLQLQEMTNTVMKLIEKIEAVERKLKESEKEHEDKNKVVDGLRKRMSDLLKESVTQGKARMEAEMKCDAMKLQLEALMKDKGMGGDDQSRTEMVMMKKMVLQLQVLLKRERGSRKRVINRYLKACCALSTYMHSPLAQVVATGLHSGPLGDLVDAAGTSNWVERINDIPAALAPSLLASSSADNNIHIADLSDSSIIDEDLVGIRNTLLTCRPLFVNVLKLNGNNITDNGAKELSLLLDYTGAFAKHALKRIDLRGNAISGLGAQLISETLRKNPDYEISNLKIHRDGLVEGLSKSSSPATLISDDEDDIVGSDSASGDDNSPNRSSSSSTIVEKVSITVDVRENNAVYNKDGTYNNPYAYSALEPSSEASSDIFDDLDSHHEGVLGEGEVGGGKGKAGSNNLTKKLFSSVVKVKHHSSTSRNAAMVDVYGTPQVMAKDASGNNSRSSKLPFPAASKERETHHSKTSTLPAKSNANTSSTGSLPSIK